MSTPLMSVVMAVYNAERYLHQAVDSILNQTFTDFELIVIDDASTDDSDMILDSYTDYRLIRLKNSQNLGLTHCLNKGLSIARGELIARHDADDISYPDRFRQQVKLLAGRPDLGLIGTGYHLISRSGQILETVVPLLNNSELQSRLEHQNCFCHGTVVFRRDCLEKAGTYRECFPVTQDYDLWLRMAEHCKLANLAAPLYQWRFDGETISRKKTDLQLAYDLLARTLAKQRRAQGFEQSIPGHVLEAFPPEPERYLHNIRRAAYLFYTAGQVGEAAELLTQAQADLSEQQNGAKSWQKWALSQAHQLAELRDEVDEGAAFIAWVFNLVSLPDDYQRGRQTIAQFYADQTFLAHRNGSRKQPLVCAGRAVRHNWHWLYNRGLWVTAWRSLWAQ